MNTIKQNKIPEIILSVNKQVKEEEVDVTRIDIYVDFLCDLSEKECYYLLNNRSITLYDNDLEFLVDTLAQTLKPYEDMEEYEFCQRIFTAINRLKVYLLNR